MGQSMGARSSWLAYRMLGDGDAASWRNLRYSRRRDGSDLPHHENEIAQSCGATGKEFARYWVHNGFVQINHEKMSKSLGNFFTIREIFESLNGLMR